MKGSNPEIAVVLPKWKVALKNWYKPYPWLELFALCAGSLVIYIGWLLISLSLKAPPETAVSPFYVSAWVSGLFFASLGIGFIGTLAGIGGGVIWSPIAMAFTPMDSVIIRASGLVVAMFNALVATGPLARSGLCNIRLGVFLMIPLGIGAFTGAQGAIYVAQAFGVTGEGIIRILALIILALFLYFLLGGKKIEYPEVKKEDGFTRFFKMHLPYFEESEGKVVDYKLNRGALFWVAVFFVGLIGGFFGMGGGWAVVPALNVIMGCPLKVAAAVSMTGLGMGSCVSVWPYFIAGAMIPIVIAPLLVGQVLGGVLGAQVLIGMRAVFVRFILIGTLLFTSFGLFTKGLELLGLLALPLWARLGFLGVCIGLVFFLIAKDYGWLSKERR
jgi:uncharacterized membrane protein YfcA